jgi:hypothetical protein
MRQIVLSVALLLMSVAALGQTYSNASLNGSYSLQFATPETETWSKTFACPTNSGITYTANGSETTSDVLYGVLTFDGNGSLSLTATEIGQINSTASANTMKVTWNSSCQVVSVNDGHIVYLAAATKTQTGTYAVQSNGTGTMNEVGSSQSQTFVLAGTSGSGVSSTVLVTDALVNGKSLGAGIAVHQ